MEQWLANLWETVKGSVAGNWHNILRFLIFLVVGAITVKIALSIVRKVINAPKSRLKGAAGNFLITLIKTALTILYGIILLSMLGVDTTSLVAIFSVLTLAISLAVQGVISNLAAGIMLVVTVMYQCVISSAAKQRKAILAAENAN